MRRNNQTLITFRERLFTAIAITFFLVIYQEVLPINTKFFYQNYRSIFSSVSLARILPCTKLILLP